LAPWFEIIAPRALKKCVATTIFKNKAQFLTPGVLSMLTSRARGTGPVLSPRRLMFPHFWISCFRRCPHVFYICGSIFFAPGSPFFHPGAITFWSICIPFLAQVNWMPLFIHVFNVFSAFPGNRVRHREHFFVHLVAKKLQRGFKFLIIFLTIFNYFGVQKRFDFASILTTFGAPRPPRDTMLRTPGVKKCDFLLDLRNPTKNMGQPKIIFHRQTKMELNFRNPKPKCE
jgi:hypothetical protein